MKRAPVLSSILFLSAAACGDVVEHLPDASNTAATFPATLEMEADCGVQLPDAVSVTITNTSTTVMNISALQASDGFVVVAPTSTVQVVPGGTLNVMVRPPAAVIG